MLIIYSKNNGDIVGVWSGNLNTLQTIYPNNNEIFNHYDQLLLNDNQNIINNFKNYKVYNNEIVKK